MKTSEFKLKVVGGINNLIDDYFGSNNISDKFINSTLKILVKQNTHKFDDILELFADEKGEIDTQEMIKEYSNLIGEQGLVFDIKQYIKSDFIKNMMPNKVLIIKKDDIINMLT